MFGSLIKKKKVTKKKPAKAKKKTQKKAFGGYQIRPDEALAKILGDKPVTPSEMTKKLWQYIKKKKLAGK